MHFQKNSAKFAGAIQWIGGKGRILNSKFIGNTAKSFTSTGGAIDIVNTEAFKVLNSTFIDNYATYKGALPFVQTTAAVLKFQIVFLMIIAPVTGGGYSLV